MGMTYNRRPVGVSVPSSNDAKHQFFNHYNWKGINQNNNFLAVDQETFSDSNNVYIDDEGLLKSRPSLKYFRGTNKIKDFEILGDIMMCTYIDEQGNWCIGAIKDGVLILVYETISYYPLRLFRSGNYVYIFVNDNVLKYDVKNDAVYSDSLYIPVTRIYDINTFETYEDDNIFSPYEKHRHVIRSSVDSENISQLISTDKHGKSGTYEYYIDSKKLVNDIQIDDSDAFLGYLHQPFSYNYSDYYTDYNVFGHKVLNTVYHENFLYKFTVINPYRAKLSRASVSDLIFEDLIFIDIFDNDELHKIKTMGDYIVIITECDCYFYNTLDGELEKLDITDVLDIVKINDSYIAVGIFGILEGDGPPEYEYLGAKIVTPGGASSIHFSEIDYLNNENMLLQKERYNIQIASAYFIDSDNFDWLNVTFQIMYKDTEGTYGFFNDTVNIVVDTRPDAYMIHLNSNYGNYVYETIGLNATRSAYVYHKESNYPDLSTNSSVVPNVVVVNDKNFSYVIVGSFQGIVKGIYKSGNSQRDFYAKVGSEYYVDKYGLYESNNNGLYLNDVKITSLEGSMVPIFKDYWSYAVPYYNVLLSNYRRSSQFIDFKIPKESSYFYPDVLNKNDKIFISKDNILTIGEMVVVDDVEMLYFKKSYKNILDYNIKNLHKISEEVMAIFTENGTWYTTLSDGVYYYYKSKIVPVLKGFSDILTLPDSTTTLLPSLEGIMALSYQNFVVNSEQSTLNMTIDVGSLYKTFVNDVKALNWKQYILFYEYNNNVILILDLRNNSWWKWTLPISVNKVFLLNDDLYVLSNGDFYKFYDNSERYVDFYNDAESNIDWHIESQKLHLNANNHYKHIVNLTLASVQEDDLPIHINLNVKNYRKYVDNGKAENFDYYIDVIRTYVKRLNYAKVCEFQYRLSSDDEASINVPLALSNISIKYKIGGQVR
jgi:hypothetical protein